MRYLALLLAPLAAGCATTFLPSYDDALFRQLDAANQELAKIDAATDTSLAPPPTFSSLEPYYTAALADLTRASQIADAKYSGVRHRPSANAALVVVQSVEVCRTAVLDLLNFNKTHPLTRESFKESSVAENCGITRSMASRLPK